MDFWQILGDVVNTVPPLGHVKGVVHYALGDTEGGNRALLSVTRSTVVIAAGALGFMAGSVAAFVSGAGAAAIFDVLVATRIGFENALGVARIIDEPKKISSWLGAAIDIGGDMCTGLGGGALLSSLDTEIGLKVSKSVAEDVASRLAFQLAPQMAQSAGLGGGTLLQNFAAVEDAAKKLTIRFTPRAVQGALLAKGIAAALDQRNKWIKARNKWRAVAAFQKSSRKRKTSGTGMRTSEEISSRP